MAAGATRPPGPPRPGRRGGGDREPPTAGLGGVGLSCRCWRPGPAPPGLSFPHPPWHGAGDTQPQRKGFRSMEPGGWRWGCRSTPHPPSPWSLPSIPDARLPPLRQTSILPLPVSSSKKASKTEAALPIPGLDTWAPRGGASQIQGSAFLNVNQTLGSPGSKLPVSQIKPTVLPGHEARKPCRPTPGRRVIAPRHSLLATLAIWLLLSPPQGLCTCCSLRLECSDLPASSPSLILFHQPQNFTSTRSAVCPPGPWGPSSAAPSLIASPGPQHMFVDQTRPKKTQVSEVPESQGPDGGPPWGEDPRQTGPRSPPTPPSSGCRSGPSPPQL